MKKRDRSVWKFIKFDSGAFIEVFLNVAVVLVLVITISGH